VRVLLTGASGLLGGWLVRTAPAGSELVGLVRTTALRDVPSVTADLRDREATRAAVRSVRPAIVIHAAYAMDEASIVDATRHVVEAAGEVGALVVFVSTDAVFAGDGVAVDEHATPAPVSDYGRWKATAERIVSAGSSDHSIVRLPLIVSVEPADHVVRQIRAGAANGEPTTWFTDEVRQPARAGELAEALWRIVSLEPAARAGVWHLPGPESLSRYAIAERVVAALGLDPDVIVATPTPPDARRPRHLHMLGSRARGAIAWSPGRVWAPDGGFPGRA
jgi:dTDP-4-dehydrorhamnose reductase